MGHIFVPTVYEDSFKGICPTHGSCLEGMASGPALMKRWNVKTAMDLPDDHLGWDYEAHYLGYAIANYILCISPEKIILGGGVMKQKHLFPKIRKKVQNVLNGYVHHKNILKNINDYIVKPGLGDNSGICGAVALAKRKIQTKSK
jgi:fructokinase